MIEKILRYLFPCTVCSLERKARLAGYDAGVNAEFSRVNKKLHLVWQVYRIGKTPGLFTYRDTFAVAAIVGAVDSLDKFPVERADDIYAGEEYPEFAYPHFGERKYEHIHAN